MLLNSDIAPLVLFMQRIAASPPAAVVGCHVTKLWVRSGAPATAEASLACLGQSTSVAVLQDGNDAEGSAVTLSTFKSLLDTLLQQKADVDGLLAAVDVDIIRINAAALKQSLIHWPADKLTELHRALPVLAAGRAAASENTRKSIMI